VLGDVGGAAFAVIQLAETQIAGTHRSAVYVSPRPTSRRERGQPRGSNG
jgi:hypothetical protein